MTKSELKSLITECINEVLNEQKSLNEDANSAMKDIKYWENEALKAFNAGYKDPDSYDTAAYGFVKAIEHVVDAFNDEDISKDVACSEISRLNGNLNKCKKLMDQKGIKHDSYNLYLPAELKSCLHESVRPLRRRYH